MTDGANASSAAEADDRDKQSLSSRSEREEIVDRDDGASSASIREKRIDSRSTTPRHSDEYAQLSAQPRNASRPRVGTRNISAHESLASNIRRLASRSSAGIREPLGYALTYEKTGNDKLIDFDGDDDPYRPINWSFRKKASTTMLYGLTTAGITFASAVYSPGTNQIMHDFNVGLEVATLGTSLMLVGFGLGPLIWAPLSELYGRKAAVLTPYFIAAVFSFATAVAKDIQTIMITRFFAGFFGSAPITNTGGVLGDIWSPQQRGPAIVVYAFAVTAGPTLGPVVGGAIVDSYLGWRWLQYITGILMMAVLVLDILFLDESYSPVLLQYKARRLRLETGDWALHAKVRNLRRLKFPCLLPRPSSSTDRKVVIA